MIFMMFGSVRVFLISVFYQCEWKSKILKALYFLQWHSKLNDALAVVARLNVTRGTDWVPVNK